MTTKRTKYRVGPFERVHLSADLDSPGDFEALVEIIKAASPQGQISTWRPHADRLRIAGDLLDQAETLLDENGNLLNVDRFYALMSKVQLLIERAQNESLNVYYLAASRASHSEKLHVTATERNQERLQKSKETNALLIAWDDEIAREYPRLNQEQRAKKILQDRYEQLPDSIAESKPPSLAKRIRKARK